MWRLYLGYTGGDFIRFNGVSSTILNTTDGTGYIFTSAKQAKSDFVTVSIRRSGVVAEIWFEYNKAQKCGPPIELKSEGGRE